MSEIKIPIAPRGGVFLMFMIPCSWLRYGDYPTIASDGAS